MKKTLTAIALMTASVTAFAGAHWSVGVNVGVPVYTSPVIPVAPVGFPPGYVPPYVYGSPPPVYYPTQPYIVPAQPYAAPATNCQQFVDRYNNRPVTVCQ